MNAVRHILIVGGVHGNELNGVYLVKTLQQPQERSLLERSHLSASTLLASPEAVAKGVRYLEMDLNRCFGRSDLANPSVDTSYEQRRAKAIYRHIQDCQADFLIDLHTTTANMGLTLLLSSDHPLNLLVAAHLVKMNPLVKVLRLPSQSDNRRLRCLCPLGMTIEAGPIAQGTLDARLFFETQRLIFAILDYLNQWNQGDLSSPSGSLTIYQHVQTLDFPRNQAGEAVAMVHPICQNRDYAPLYPGDPLFITFEGTVMPYKGTDIIYPVFVHESAYWEKGIAMYLTRKQEIPLGLLSRAVLPTLA